jgi:hypothetical protein
MSAAWLARLDAWRKAMEAESVATVASDDASVATPELPVNSTLLPSVATVANAFSDEGESLDIVEVWEGETDLPAAPGDEHQHATGGLLRAALMRPASWTERPDCRPAPGAWCGCCGRIPPAYGGRWWQEREAPKGWRCWTCHPPDHLKPAKYLVVAT